MLLVINELDEKRNDFAQYIIDQTTGTCSLHGSTRSEQNHSSIRSFIGKDYVGEIEDILLILLNRQRTHATQHNQLIFQEEQYMLIKNRKLIDAAEDPILINASNTLNKWEYNMFYDSFIQVPNYKIDQSLEDQSYKVYRIGKENKPRVFQNKQSRCNCTTSVSMQQMCVHELVMLNEFRKDYFDVRWHRRSNITYINDVGE